MFCDMQVVASSLGVMGGYYTHTFSLSVLTAIFQVNLG